MHNHYHIIAWILIFVSQLFLIKVFYQESFSHKSFIAVIGKNFQFITSPEGSRLLASLSSREQYFL